MRKKVGRTIDALDIVELVVALRSRPAWNIGREVERHRLTHGISAQKAWQVRDRLIERYDAEVHKLQEPVFQYVRALGGEIQCRQAIGNLVYVRLPRYRVPELSGHPDVRSVASTQTPLRPCGPDNYSFLLAGQAWTYWLSQITGRRRNPMRPNLPSITIGFIDRGFQNDVPWLRTSSGASRVVATYDCANGGCRLMAPNAILDRGLHGSHLTAIAAGNFLGDQWRIQQPVGFMDPFGTPPTPLQKQQASGIAPDASIALFNLNEDNLQNLITSVQTAGAIGCDILVIARAPYNDTARQRREQVDCTGNSPLSAVVDDVANQFGTFIVNAAGEIPLPDTEVQEGVPCLLLDPSGAAWTFAVGGSGSLQSCQAMPRDTAPREASRLRTMPLDNVAPGTNAGTAVSRTVGQVAYKSGVRTLLKLRAPAFRDFTPYRPVNGRVYFTGCTFDAVNPSHPSSSIATAYVAGAAALVKDWMIERGYPAAIYDSPGVLQALLLLMGDEHVVHGGCWATERAWDPDQGCEKQPMVVDQAKYRGFAGYKGMGRLLMRQLDGRGLRAPYCMGVGVVPVVSPVPIKFCMCECGNQPNAASVVIEGDASVAGACVDGCRTLPRGSYHLKVAAWWPEPNLENAGADGADIKLGVRVDCGPAPTGRYSRNPYLISDTLVDTHKVLFSSVSVDQRCLQLEFAPAATPPNPWLGNEWARLVYFAYYIENALAGQESLFRRSVV